jgi:hypothetical protein
MIFTETSQLQDAPPATEPDASAGDLFHAEREAEAVRTDAWSYGLRVRMDVQRDIYDRLPGEAQKRAQDFLVNRGADEDSFERFLLNEAGIARSAGDPVWSDVPATADDITAEVNRRRQAVLDEADELSGGNFTFSGFLGQMTTAATDRTSLALIPLGGGAGSIGRVALREAGLGMLGEAMVLPREFEVAEELGLEDPNVPARLLLGATFGGVIGAGLAAAPRAVNYLLGKRRASDASKPDGVNPVEFRDEVEAQRDRIENGDDNPIPQDRPDVPLRLSDFEFDVGGNASPQTNRVGYVFGRLIERGMEPHVAAGFVGNFMVEAGPTINPSIVGDGGAALGMAQWNDRRPALIAFARAQGKPPTDLDVQIDFLFHELATSEASAAQRIFQATTAQEAAQLVSNLYERPGIPHMPRRVAHASSVFQDYQSGRVPRWKGSAPDEGGQSSFAGYTSSRPFTGTGQVRAGDDIRVDVEYEVVDISALRQAAGDLQPRDRGRVNSDAWVADTAARLDPAQLLDSPWADRGAPLVGPDGIIESGNGRVRAIQRAYDQVPDRADAYRQAIEERTGRPIPEDVERPVLIARRTSDLDPDSRRQLVVDAQDSGVARMTATERAQVGRRALNSDLMERYRSGVKLGAAENRDFARGFAGAFPRSERNAFISGDGRLSIDGVRQIQDSLFARAWDAPDIIARAVEAEPGDLKTLIDALSDAAPEFARLKADIDAGLVHPDMDISPFVLEAVRVIMAARDAAGRGGAIAEIIEEMLADEDLLLGGLSPLTQALVRKFMPNGRQVPAGKISQFLKNYADEARKAGRTGSALDPVGPVDVLRQMEPRAFGDLTETGAIRAGELRAAPVDTSAFEGDVFADGAASPDVVAADIHLAEKLRTEIAPGPFGPIIDEANGDPQRAISRLLREKDGEVPAAVTRDDLGDIALVYGNEKFGLRHIEGKHPEILPQLPEILTNGELVHKIEGDRAYLQLPGDGASSAVIRLNWDGADKTWLVTAFQDHQGQITRQGRRSSNGPPASASPKIPDATGNPKDNPSARLDQDAASDQIRTVIEDLRANSADLDRLPDGNSFDDILTDLDADEALDAAIDLCVPKGGR